MPGRKFRSSGANRYAAGRVVVKRHVACAEDTSRQDGEANCPPKDVRLTTGGPAVANGWLVGNGQGRPAAEAALHSALRKAALFARLHRPPFGHSPAAGLDLTMVDLDATN